MKNINIFILLCFIFSFKIITAQTLQPEGPSLLPESTVSIVKAPSYSPKSDLINLAEQTGLYPYKGGHQCEDESMSFETGTDGKLYGANEYSKIFLKSTEYGTDARELFNNTKPYDERIKQLLEFASSMQNEPVATGTTRSVLTHDVSNGKMVLIVDEFSCPQSKHKKWTSIHFRSIGLAGTIIADIMGSYNSDNLELAKTIHSEIMAKVGNTP